jgi:hypothetical protein
MIRILYIASLITFFHIASFAQEGEGKNAEKMRQRMSEYIQNGLKISKPESERFSPVFIDYFNALRKTSQQYRGDRLMLQQKIAELRLRYRDQFKPILGEQRSNNVFVYERKFVEEVKRHRRERNQNRKISTSNKKT